MADIKDNEINTYNKSNFDPGGIEISHANDIDELTETVMFPVAIGPIDTERPLKSNIKQLLDYIKKFIPGLKKGNHAEIFNDYENNSVNGNYSHAEGQGTVTSNTAEHAEGKYNKSNPNTISSIGIGESIDSGIYRKNAIEVHSDGKVFINGIGGYIGSNDDFSSLKSVLEIIDSKLDVLQSELNIKTVNGVDIVGEGNALVTFPLSDDDINECCKINK